MAAPVFCKEVGMDLEQYEISGFGSLFGGREKDLEILHRILQNSLHICGKRVIIQDESTQTQEIYI